MKQSRLTKSVSLLLTVLIITAVLSVAPFTVSAARSGISGSCTWTLDDDGTLTISGNGAMNDHFISPFPNNVVNVIVEDGVTRIGNYAFYQCTSLESITIPDSVTEIGKYAFYECGKLTNVVGGVGLKEIDIFAFANTAWLNSRPEGMVYLNKVALKYIGDCSDEIRIKDGTYSISCHAFEKCTGLKSVIMPDSLKIIGTQAFDGCTGLRSVVLPVGLERIDGIAFQKCTDLKVVTIPYGVTTIGDYAFNICSGLIHAEIPDSVTSIGKGAFRSCDSLESVTIPASVTEIGNEAFGYTYVNGGLARLDGFTICGKKGTAAETYADKNKIPFVDVDDVSPTISGATGDCEWSYDAESKTLTISGSGATANYDFENRAPWSELDIRHVVVKEGVEWLRSGAFIDADAESVALPGSLHTIGMIAFDGCSKLKTINLPDGLKTIGGGAFQGCAALETADLPEGLKQIGPFAFRGCTSLEYITVPDTVDDMGVAILEGTKWFDHQPDGMIYTGKVFYGYKGDMPANASLAIREGTVSVAAGAIAGSDTQQENLVAVTFPDSVTCIGGNAFFGCDNLKSVTVPATVTQIAEGAFGYYYDETADAVKPYHDFTICGEKGSAAEKYANDNGFVFQEVPKTMIGDVNGDGKVNGADAGLLSRYTSGWDGYEVKIKDMKAADINGDGKVNGADAGLLSRYTSGWDSVKKYFDA